MSELFTDEELHELRFARVVKDRATPYIEELEQRIQELEAGYTEFSMRNQRIKELEDEIERLREALRQLAMAESELVRNHVRAALEAKQ